MPATLIGRSAGTRQSLWLTLGLWGFTYLTFLMPSFADHGSMAWYGYPIIAAAVAVGLLLSAPLYLLLLVSRRWPLAPRVAVVAVAAAVAAGVHSVLDASIVMVGRTMLAPATVTPITLERLADKFGNYIWIYETYVTAIGLILSAASAHERERLLGAARVAAHQAELAALRFQINPHFLFNTLNAISSLIVTGRAAQADDMLGRLSGFLRASLAGGPNDQIALAEELETLAAYLDIEQVRFGDRLRFEMDCPGECEDALVPGFILQPLVENAVKYAVGPSRNGATIRLGVECGRDALRLCVTDDGEGGAAEAGTGLGLENIRNRLEILYGREAALEAGPTADGYSAVISLPLYRTGLSA
ncbi:MAG: histidine kinase [Actinomycetospora chiangmaiensis]|nr:histidine kinase [Actinomycetospora chiangmaiensis]